MAGTIDDAAGWETYVGQPRLPRAGETFKFYLGKDGALTFGTREQQVLGEQVQVSVQRETGCIGLLPEPQEGRGFLVLYDATDPQRRTWLLTVGGFWQWLQLDPTLFYGHYPAVWRGDRLVLELGQQERRLLRGGPDPDL